MTPAPGSWEVLTAWRAMPVGNVLVGIALIAYLLAARAGRVGSEDRPWPRRRSVSWVAGLVLLVVAIDSPVETYGQALFWVHMIQHLLLIMVVPVLLIWGRPLTLLDRVVRRDRVRRALGSAPARLLTFPLLTLAGYAAVLVLTHLTGFQEAMVTHMWVHDLEQVLYLVTGYLFFLPLVGDEMAPWLLSYPLRLALLALSMGVDTLVGVALMLTTHPLAPAYAALRPGWGPTPLQDQGVAGAIMWFGGDGLMVLLMVIVSVQWSRADPARQGLGSWVERARRDALTRAGLLPAGPGDSLPVCDDVDDDRALAAYNAMLARLARAHPHRGDDRPRSG